MQLPLTPMPQGKCREDKGMAPEDKIRRARAIIFQYLPFFASLVVKAHITVVKQGITTACITPDGHITISEAFLSTLSSDKVAGLLIHEVMHPALQYFPRAKVRNKIVFSVSPEGVKTPVALFNLAQDYFINHAANEARESFFQASGNQQLNPFNLPEKGLYNSAFAGMSSEEIYDSMLKELEEEKQEGNGGGDSIEGEFSPDVDPNGRGDPKQGLSEKDLEEKWKNALIEAKQAHERYNHRGTIPSGILKLIEEILNPRVYWKDVVSRWAGEHGSRGFRTYMRPSRRSDAVGVILPSLRKSDISDICVILDTSGSMGGRENELVSETIAIAEDLNLKLRVICIDSEIHFDGIDITSPEDIEFKGGGGSDLCPAFAKLQIEMYSGAVIVFTDGYIGVPPSQPSTLKAVLWVLFAEHHDQQPAPWGEAVRIDPDGFTHVESGLFK